MELGEASVFASGLQQTGNMEMFVSIQLVLVAMVVAMFKSPLVAVVEKQAAFLFMEARQLVVLVAHCRLPVVLAVAAGVSC